MPLNLYFHISPWGQWRDYWCGLYSLGNSSSASGSSDPVRTVGLVATRGGRQARATVRPVGLFFLSPLQLFLFSLFSACLLSISILLFPCTNVWENTRARVPHIIAILILACLFALQKTTVSSGSGMLLNKISKLNLSYYFSTFAFFLYFFPSLVFCCSHVQCVRKNARRKVEHTPFLLQPH